MKSRARRRRMLPRTPPASTPPPPVLPRTATAPAGWRQRVVWGVTAVALCALGSWAGYRLMSGKSATEPKPGETIAPGTEVARKAPAAKPEEPSSPATPKTAPKKGPAPASSFLDAFGEKGTEPKTDKQEPVLANAELEKQFQTLADARERIKALKQQVMAAPGKFPPAALRKVEDETNQLVQFLNKELDAFQKHLTRARQARPADGVPQWLTGELLILIGGEPEEMLPYFQKAVAGGLDRPRFWASLARALVEANQFTPAYDAAVKGLAGGGQERYVWNAFVRAAFALEKFATVVDRVEQAFPGQPPEWAVKMRHDAMLMEAKWQAEQRLRRAEQQADLPRVRLVIEHRRFARDAGGAATTRIESTGQGEVLLELFEDQAPNTVANFLQLAAGKVYDGTRFYRADAAAMVAGGDPKSKTGDAAGDGTGGPGYVIPDEFQRPGARGHFRGCVSMVNTGPGTAGSQFFITVVPMPSMDGHFTVFGRVLEGQDVVDRISRGRTNPEVGFYGRLIPGDLLVRAEVLRKRPHEYKVLKERPVTPQSAP